MPSSWAAHDATGAGGVRFTFEVVADAYLGLGPGDPRSLAGWMRRSFTEPLGITDDRVTWLEGRRYRAELCALRRRGARCRGLRPGRARARAERASRVQRAAVFDRCTDPVEVELTPESLVSNAAYWGDDVPRRAVTAGMDLIMQARSVLLIVSGSHKRAILARMLHGEPSPLCPASLLRLREGVVVAADRSALGR